MVLRTGMESGVAAFVAAAIAAALRGEASLEHKNRRGYPWVHNTGLKAVGVTCMNALRRKLSVYLVALVLCLPGVMPREAVASRTFDRAPTEISMVVDGLLVRPIGMAATVVGGAVFIVTLPFSLLGGNVSEASEALVVKPARYTFARPLGEFRR